MKTYRAGNIEVMRENLGKMDYDTIFENPRIRGFMLHEWRLPTKIEMSYLGSLKKYGILKKLDGIYWIGPQISDNYDFGHTFEFHKNGMGYGTRDKGGKCEVLLVRGIL